MDHVVVCYGTANRPLGEAVAAELKAPIAECRVERFPDGEISAQLDTSVRKRHVFILQPTAPPVNDHLMELVGLADACRRAAAERVTAVVPYFGYARGDRRGSRRVPVMGRAAADVLETSGIHHLVTIDLHSPQLEGFFRIPVENLTAIPTLAASLQDGLPSDTVIVSPDYGAVERVGMFAGRVGRPMAIIPKRRISGSEVEVGTPIGRVEGRDCLIVDDMISTGGTLVRAVEALREAGAKPQVRVAATHGVFSGGAVEKLLDSGISEILVTDSIAASPDEPPGVRRVSIAPLLAAALKRLTTGDSLRDLY